MNRTQIIYAIVLVAVLGVGAVVMYKMRVIESDPPASKHSDISSTTHTTSGDDPMNISSWPLVDGTKVPVLGKFRDAPIQNGVHAYSSDKLGISFNYPNNYMLFEEQGTSASGMRLETLSIVLDASVRELLASTAARGLPPVIRLSFYAEPNTAVSLEEWIPSRSESNFDPAYVSPNTLTPTTIAGAPAFSYRVVGMYDTEYVAFRHGSWVVLATLDTMDGRNQQDFQTILSTIRLK